MNPNTSINRRMIRDNPDVLSRHLGATFAVPADDLFRRLTDTEHLSRWFGTVTRDEFVFEIEGNAHGRIESCTENSFLITWEKDGDLSYLNVEITPTAEGSELAAGFSTADEGIDAVSRERYGWLGWDLSLWALDRYISGVTEDPTRDSYEAFVISASDAWARADEASGVDTETANLRADNTRRFYLGREE
ncbi:hypothetical protein GCM10027580_14680 [Corynebacterium faecale]|uniref:hypothetical protein n=1 Tax=Corynebacterium faecale TaxID=1758466 RepID=UPI0025B4E42F|nr:hypothetical protein [Corynebacterium faecale]